MIPRSARMSLIAVFALLAPRPALGQSIAVAAPVLVDSLDQVVGHVVDHEIITNGQQGVLGCDGCLAFVDAVFFLGGAPVLVSVNGFAEELVATWPTDVVYESTDCSGPAYLILENTPGFVQQYRTEVTSGGTDIWYPMSSTSQIITVGSYRSGKPVCTGEGNPYQAEVLPADVAATPWTGPYRIGMSGDGAGPNSVASVPAVSPVGLLLLGLGLVGGTFVLFHRNR